MTKDCVLVTGGAGYIGSHACKALAGAGYQPVTYDSLVTGYREAVKWGPLEIGDTLDRQRLGEVMEQYSPRAVMHFAGFIAVGESVADPAKYYENNITGSLNLLLAMQQHGIDRIVFSSSAAVYGEPETPLITEHHPKRPINPYGFSKYAVERMLEDFAAARQMRSVALRYFNAAGADPDGEIGEAHQPETHLIPIVLEAAAGQRDHVLIFGDGYATPDGTCVRDYIHVSDLADAHVRALGYLDRSPGAAAFNLGNGNGFSVRQIIDVARRVTSRQIPTRIAPARAGDSAVLVADISQAVEKLGWAPRYTSVEDQLGHAWNWHRKHAQGHRQDNPA
jgi:UDP-arabinose 4-epimerase